MLTAPRRPADRWGLKLGTGRDHSAMGMLEAAKSVTLGCKSVTDVTLLIERLEACQADVRISQIPYVSKESAPKRVRILVENQQISDVRKV